MASVSAVCISERKGTRKKEVPYLDVLPHHGIVGDAHAGDWHRQISLLAQESIDTMTVLLQIVCTKNAEFVEINSGLSVSNLLHPRNFTGLKLGKKTS